MLKIVNQTTYPIEYDVWVTVPTSQHIGRGKLEPNTIAAYRVDNEPNNGETASNCRVGTWCTGHDGRPVTLDILQVPGNSTVVFSTQIVTGILKSGA